MTDAAFWDGIAEEYARKPVADPAAFERKIAITEARLGAHAEVLDIGCGTGSLALRLSKSARHVHGLDASQEMIRIARGKAGAQDATNVTFHVGAFDESFATLQPGSLDVVCAYSILHLVPDRRAAIDRIFRLLAPGGSLVSSTVCLGESWVPYRPFLAVMRWLGKAPRVSVFSAHDLVEDLTRAGFVEIERPDVGADTTIAFVVARKPR